MKIKRHKIKISSESESSGFVLDLRASGDGLGSKIDQRDEPSFTKKNKTPLFNFRKTSLDPIDNKKIKRDLKKYLFFEKNINSGNSRFLKYIKKVSIFSLLILILKNIRNFVWFFIDWMLDVYYFIERYVFFIKKREENNVSKKNIFRKNNIFRRDSGELVTAKKRRPLWMFVMLLFLLIIPFKVFSYYRLVAEKKIQDNLWGLSSSALNDFVSASEKISQLDLGLAQRSFFQAGENFLLLDQELKKIDGFIVVLASFSGDEHIRLAAEAKKIAKIGIHLSSAGDNFSLAMDSLISAFSEGEEDVSGKFSSFENYFYQAEKDFKNVNKYLNKIKDKSIPVDYRDQFVAIRDIATLLEKNLTDFRKTLPGLKDFLAIDSDKRYLVVFQNNAEIRATGGFIGSYALIDLSKGKLKKIEVPPGGSYDTEGGMRVLVESPRPLHLVKPIWYFWDANWWPDWKMSAQNLMWFYERSGGPSVDGVISLTPDVLADVLSIIGPIDLNEEYGVVIDSENFWEIIQEIVEVIGQPEIYQNKNLRTSILDKVSTSTPLITKETERENDSNNETKELENSELFLRNEPKKIIGDLMAKILEEFSGNFSRGLLVDILGIMEKNLSQKNILLYFVNDKMQIEAEKKSWAGRVKNSPLDYLMVVNSSVAGGKTDYFIENNFSLEVQIDEAGDIFNKLIIRRSHQGVRGDLFSGLRNVNWMRIYVPLGSSLVSAKGFSSLDEKHFKTLDVKTEKNNILEKTEYRAEIDSSSGTKVYQENGKTVFANWNITDPGDDIFIEIIYRLPYNIYSLLDNQSVGFWERFFPKEPIQNYSLLWQKQAGARAADLKVSFSSDLKLDPVWSYPDSASGDLRLIKLESILDHDRYFVVILK